MKSCMMNKSIKIPDSYTSINNKKFYNYKSLKSITLPELIAQISDYMFDILIVC